MSVPKGPITTRMPEGGASGIDWSAITRYDGLIHEHADPVGWPIARVRGHITIESHGDPRAVQRNRSNGDSYGLLQVVPYGVRWEGWHALVKEKAGLRKNASRQEVIDALYRPEVNIAVGVAILESFYQQYGTLDRASSAFFLGKPFWDGQDTVNGNTGIAYRDSLNGLIAEQEAFAPVDIIGRIVGGVPYTAPFGFGMPNFDANGRPLNFYQYGVGHGDGLTAPHLHTGLDVNVPLGTTIVTPLAGRVLCVGGRGQNLWGQGCGAFADTLSGGVGNITLLSDAGLKLTFGHMGRALVDVGQRVEAWQPIGLSGGMIGPHFHLDAVTERGGTYWLHNPIPAIARVRGQDVPPAPPSYADPLPNVPATTEFEVFVTVTATRDNVPVLQRADLASAPTNKPLAKGDTFEAVYQVLGNDRRVYWLTRRGSRVPVEGTSAPEWTGFVVEPSPPAVNVDAIVDEIEAARGDVDRRLRDIIARIGDANG